MSGRFELIRHSDGGRGCAAYEQRLSNEQAELVRRIEALTPSFYDDIDAGVLMKLIRSGDDLGGVAQLVSMAQEAVTKMGGQL